MQKAVTIYRDLGKDKAYINKYKNDTRQYKKDARYLKKKQTANERSKILKDLGYKISGDVAKMRYWGQARWDQWLKEELAKRDVSEKNHLLILWRDKTGEGYASDDVIRTTKAMFRGVDEATVLQDIKFYLKSKHIAGNEIGMTHMNVLKGKEISNYLSFYTHISLHSSYLSDGNDWLVLYKGRCVRYKELLVAIATAMRLLYDQSERSEFITSLMFKFLPMINPQFARQLTRDLEWTVF